MEATGFCGFVVWAFETVAFLCIHWYLLGSVKRTPTQLISAYAPSAFF